MQYESVHTGLLTVEVNFLSRKISFAEKCSIRLSKDVSENLGLSQLLIDSLPVYNRSCIG